MRFVTSLVGTFVLASALTGCTAASDDPSDEYFEPETAEVSTSELTSKSSLVGSSYLIRGQFSLKSFGRPAQSAGTPLGKGWAMVTITRQFKGTLPGFAGDHHAKIAADVRVGYRTANGSFKVAQASNRDFEPEARGYGPFMDVVDLGEVSAGVTISSFGKRALINAEIDLDSGVAGKFIEFAPTSMIGPF